MTPVVRVFNLIPSYSYEVGVLCETVEQGEEFVSWHSGQISREMGGDYHGCEVEHLPEHDGAYSADYDATKPLEKSGLEYSELLKIAREGAEGLLRDALWDLHFSEQAEKDVLKSIEMRKIDCVKLGLDVDAIVAEFEDEYSITDEDEGDDDGNG